MDDNDRTTENRRFAKNTGWVFLGQIGAKLSGLVFFIVVARILGVREYGYFNFAVSFVPLFLVFGTLGVDSITVRELARDRHRVSEMFASAMVTRLLFGGAGLVAAVASGFFFADDATAFITLIFVGTALLIDEITSLYTSVFRAFERMSFNAIVKVSNRTVSTFLAVLVLIAGGGMSQVVMAYLLGSLAALVYAHYTLRKRFPPTRIRDARRRTIRTLLVEGRTLGIAGILNLALFRIDTVMVEVVKGATAVSFYGVAYRFFESSLFVAMALTTVALPRLAKQGLGDRARHTFELLMTMSMSFYLPIAVGAPFAAEWLIENVFGARYSAAADAVPWLSAAAVFYAVAYLGRTTMIALGHRRAIVQIALAALITNVGLNLYLIPTQGFVGAAIATFLVEIFEAFLTLVALRKIGVDASRLPLVLIPIFSAGIMGIVLFVLGLQDAAAVGVGITIYGSVLFVTTRVLAPHIVRNAISLMRRSGTEVPRDR